MSRAASPTQTIKVKSFELKDDQRWAFDLQLVQQTKGAANPADVNGVLGDYIAKLVARHCEVDGMDDAEWLTFFRATYRPAAGKVFTINIRETLKPLIPKALPVNIFVQDPSDPDSSSPSRERPPSSSSTARPPTAAGCTSSSPSRSWPPSPSCKRQQAPCSRR
jgi:hypothetical protein